MADVKYTNSSWEKMGRDLGNLIGSGWGKGIHEELISVTKNLEKAEENIETYDEDGIITFTHANHENTYKEIGEKFTILKDFTGKVNDILTTEIDDPFHTKLDAYVSKLEELNIDTYSTANTLGVTETRSTINPDGSATTYEVKKKNMTVSDILGGDNPVGKAMVDEWKEYLANNPEAEGLSYGDYKEAKVNSGAFEYQSIKDKQSNKEFWFNMGVLATTIVVGIICPPAGMALGAAFGAYEMATAVAGKDLISGRKLGTGEKILRFGLGALGVFGGVKGILSFSNNVKLVTNSSSKMEHVVNMVKNSSISNFKDITVKAKALKVAEKASGLGKNIENINPSEIRFSQTSVNGSDEIIASMKANGWKGDPIDVVRMPDGSLTTIDNTRVAAAREVGIDVQANVRSYDTPLPNQSTIDRFTTKKGVPKTWGEAIELRVGKQKADFRNNNPMGSFDLEQMK